MKTAIAILAILGAIGAATFATAGADTTGATVSKIESRAEILRNL